MTNIKITLTELQRSALEVFYATRNEKPSHKPGINGNTLRSLEKYNLIERLHSDGVPMGDKGRFHIWSITQFGMQFRDSIVNQEPKSKADGGQS